MSDATTYEVVAKNIKLIDALMKKLDPKDEPQFPNAEEIEVFRQTCRNLELTRRIANL